jgi:hypothetical protein
MAAAMSASSGRTFELAKRPRESGVGEVIHGGRRRALAEPTAHRSSRTEREALAHRQHRTVEPLREPCARCERSFARQKPKRRGTERPQARARTVRSLRVERQPYLFVRGIGLRLPRRGLGQQPHAGHQPSSRLCSFGDLGPTHRPLTLGTVFDVGQKHMSQQPRPAVPCPLV